MPVINERSTQKSIKVSKLEKRRTRPEGEKSITVPRQENGHMNREVSKSTTNSKQEGRHTESKGNKSKTVKNFGTGQAQWLAVYNDVLSFIKTVLGWVFDVLGGTFNAIKTPISYLIAFYLLYIALAFLRNIIFTPISGALTPLCRLPGASFLPLSMCRSPMSSHYKGDETPTAEFDQLVNVQNKFEDVIEHTVPGASLPLDMKRSEHAVRDLRAIVGHSKLPSAGEFVFEFNGYIEAVNKASWDMSTFNVHIRGAVDRIVMHSKVTRRNLEGMNIKRASQGAIGTFVRDWFISPLTPITFGKDNLLEEYLQHMDIVKREVAKLIEEGKSLEDLLKKLEDHLEAIHGLSIRDNHKAQLSRDQVLSELWTVFGGNRSRLRMTEADLRLLMQVNKLRKQAVEHVGGTMVKLQDMHAELHGLKERVITAETTEDVPIDMHIVNMDMGVERLHAASIAGKEEADRLWTESRRRFDEGKEFDDGRLLDSTAHVKLVRSTSA